MIDRSLPDPARVGSPRSREMIADAVERELDRLRQARPGLVARIDRAGQILLRQLSLPPRQRPLRVRVRSDGRDRRVLARSMSEPDLVYTVDAESFECSCPDAAHHGGRGCKHGISAWILGQVDHRRPRSQLGCAVCNAGWVTISEVLVSEETGEAEEVHNVIPCRRCRPTEPPLLTAPELEEWMASVRWIYAWSYHDTPHLRHEYTLKKEQDLERFERVVATIWTDGWNRRFVGRKWRTLDIGEHIVWLNRKPSKAPGETTAPPDAILINRAPRSQPRLVDNMHRAE